MSQLGLVPRSLLALLLVAGATRADTQAFPLAGPAGALKPVPERLAALAQQQAVRLTGVPLAGGAVALELVRVPIAAQGAALAVNGERQSGVLDAGLSLWTGHVAGAPDSEVFLAFSAAGSRGWVRHAGTLQHLVAQPGADGHWSGTTSRWAGDAELLSMGARLPPPCQTMKVARNKLPHAPSAPATADGGTLPLLEAHIVLETDDQYFQIFGNEDAARTYVLSLFGAVSARYREQIGVILTVPYLGLHTDGNDPWFWQDNGGSSLDVLFEFQEAWGVGWGGSPPQAGDLYHIISGADLGGGVAYLPALCDQDYGFACSGNIGGNTPIPIAVGPLNWDFMVIAHETGHNFGAPHTHDYCPPLDECAPAGYFGQCQTQEVCTTAGTLMSYCHICGNGMTNITTYFHPQSVADMRALAEGGCLQPFEGVLATDLGFAKAGAGGTPSLAATYSKNPSTLHLDATGLPPLKPGSLFLSTTQALVSFKGGILVPAPQIQLMLVSSVAGQLPVALPVTFSFPSGLVLYAQEWFKDSGPGYAATNGVRFELIKP